MTPQQISVLADWILFGVSQALLGASVMMIIKGTLPPPFSKKKASPILATSIMLVGLTMMIVFGKENLLKSTLELFGA